ncbi:MAG: hypothetical protein P4L46_00030 [Fimbriimonas sp.]|nr:hypothetical protein [Fimbriimonas sp.]
MRKTWLFLVVALLLSAVVAARRQSKTTKQILSKSVVGQDRSHRWKVTAFEWKESRKGAVGDAWGAFSEIPNWAVGKLAIDEAGVSVDVPRSVYADLTNVNRLTCRSSGKGCTISIEGGDAASGYVAEVVVKNGKVDRRRVREGEFPENHWEQTTYVNTMDTLDN